VVFVPEKYTSGMGLSKEKLERLIARSTDVVCATDRKGLVAYYNDGASEILGYRPEEILGTFVGRLYPDVAEAKRVMQAMRDPGSGGPGVCSSLQATYLSKTGEKIPVAITGTLLYDEEGREDGTIGFAKDLRQILHKDQLATLGEVAMGLSHEINNPLAVMLNQAELLERDVDALAGERDASVELERIDAIRREVARVSGIVERLGRMVETDHYETIEYVGPARMIDLRERRPSAPSDGRLAGLRILIVDDDLGICRSLKEILEGEGCVVDTAQDGVEGLSRVESATYDLVLSDVVMPRMDGYELYKAIRSSQPHLPILMMTAFHYDKDHIIKRSRVEGLEGVIFKKPVDPARLREVILETTKR
jgi:PAS domain S-box-containing protein